MSKIGKINISIPEKVKVILSGNLVNIEGPLGKKTLTIDTEHSEDASQAQLPSSIIPNFSLSDAYRIALEIKEIREGKKEKALGIKVGFTNKTIWEKYSVNAPIFGFMYSTTVLSKEQLFSPEKFLEPRFEPEIFFKLRKKPDSEMSDMVLISCCESIGIGVELVQSIYKGWIFKLPDTVSWFGLHGQYKILEEREIPSDENNTAAIIDQLTRFNLTLRKNNNILWIPSST